VLGETEDPVVAGSKGMVLWALSLGFRPTAPLISLISPEFECKALGIHHFYAAITSRKIFEAVNEALKTRLRILKNLGGSLRV